MVKDVLRSRAPVQEGEAHYRVRGSAKSYAEVSGGPGPGVLRACFAELKDQVFRYALGHEKDLRHRPFGRRVGLSTRSPTRTTQDREDAYPRPARRLRRYLLRLEERLPLADVAWRLSTLTYHLLPLPQVPTERPLAPDLRDLSCGGEEEGR